MMATSFRLVALVSVAALALACGDADESSSSSGDGGSGNGSSTGGSGAGTSNGGAGATAGSGGMGSGGMATGGSSSGGGGAAPTGCTPAGLDLIAEINAYRATVPLPAIPASSSLCIVSETHVMDLATNNPSGPDACNLHSWSDQGSWSACCYTPDHAQAQCMWDKPGELSAYPGNGYEIAASGTSSAAQAVMLWQGSPGHNDVIINAGIWQSHPWGAVGAAIDNGYAVVWFGEETDPMP